jgi:uncharacterized repeat protein (TIGR03803 family)
MRGKAEFRSSIAFTISFATAVALLVLLVVVATRAQNPVPPTAREAAASPALASKLHPATRPATKKPRASALPQQNQVIYENGPVNGTTDAWTINYGYIVSDTFVPNNNSQGPVSGFDIYVWEFPGDSLTSLQWSITSGPNSGTVYGSGTISGSNLTDTFISTNQYGYDIDKISASGLNVTVTPGSTYWINLQNASVPSGDPVFWDENSGAGCQSQGCPSQAVESAVGTIPSEAFDVTSNCEYGCQPPPPPCPGSGGGLQIIHDFGGDEGSYSSQGVAVDRAGNLFGTNGNGGDNGGGLAYELSPNGQGWVFADLYSFGGPSGGVSPSPVIVGPDAALYGTAGGGSQNCPFGGCGLVFSLRPAPTACLTALCSWTETTLYQPTGYSDAYDPGNLVFDQAGNLYGTSGSGGAYGKGAVFELTPSSAGWTETILYSFTGGNDGGSPNSLLVGIDGNLYGSSGSAGAGGEGVVFQLVRPSSGNAWTENVIYTFTVGNNDVGSYSLVQDSFGNLYGLGNGYTGQGNVVVVFMLSPSNGSWVFSMVYTAPGGYHPPYQTSDLAIDAAGILYLAIGHLQEPGSPVDGSDPYWGAVMIGTSGGFSNLWYSDNVDFIPTGPLAVDAGGNVYGTTMFCGQNNAGTIWRVRH